MRIVDIREKTLPISSPIRNAYIDFSKMTLSLVAVITDVVRDGKPVVGYGFNSNGRYGQGQLMRERFLPRVMEAEPDIAARRAAAISTRTRCGTRCSGTKSRAATASARWRSAPSTWRSGTRSPRSRKAAVPAAGRPLRRRQRQPQGVRLCGRRLLLPGQGRPAAEGRDAQLPRPRLLRGQDEDRRRLAGRRPAPHRFRAVILQDGQRLCVDANGRFDLDTAIAYAKALSQYNLFWYEEAGRPARLRAAGRAAQLLQEPDGDRREPVLDAGRAQPDSLRRHARRPRLAAVRLRALLRPGRIPAHAGDAASSTAGRRAAACRTAATRCR